MDLLTVQHLTFAYPNRAAPALRDVSFSLRAGDFVVLCGRSGSGKTTLLRQLKPALAPRGTLDGRVLWEGQALSARSPKQTAADIAFVQQDPRDQIVTDTVRHELAFGAESLGMDPQTICRRVAETAAFFGIEDLIGRSTADLSGGQAQLLNLAAAMVLQPKLLLLDEPTAQLDPVAADTFFAALQKVNRELGVAVLMTEHRLETALTLATAAAVLENGTLLCFGDVTAAGEMLRQTRNPLFFSMPAAMQLWCSVESAQPCPVSVGEGREFLGEYLKDHPACPVPQRQPASGGDTAVTVEELTFGYGEGPVLRNLSFTAQKGTLTCILGGNGAGKSTLLSLLAGQRTPERGTLRCKGRVGLLPQQTQTLFIKKTVWSDLCTAGALSEKTQAERETAVRDMLDLCGLRGLEDRHPFDLSGGEMQRAALAKVLLGGPDILLLDEPTKGFDAAFKRRFASVLEKLKAKGVCIVMVSHDVEFCARTADVCALLFDGALVGSGPPQEFFGGNRFYTTQASRISRGLLPDVITAPQLIAGAGGTAPAWAENDAPAPEPLAVRPVQPQQKPLARWRKVGAGLSAVAALVLFVLLARTFPATGMQDVSAFTALTPMQKQLGGAFFFSLLAAALFTAKKQPETALPQTKRKLPLRTWFGAGLCVCAIPPVLWYGTTLLPAKQYYLTALAVLVLAMLPFFLVFEGRRPRARELALLAALCAVTAAGRAAFFMLPQCKPVLAMTALVGVALGGESGFLVGAVTMLVSNLLFAQGAWTPWQMFAMGLVGGLAGLLARLGLLRRSRLSLCVFGALAAVVIYGGVMNPAAALIWGGEVLNREILLTYYAAGFPMDCVHAAATVLFLWFLAPTVLDTLQRVKEKYGVFETGDDG